MALHADRGALRDDTLPGSDCNDARPVWTFKGWYAFPQPSVTVESVAVTKAFAAALGRRPNNPLIRVRYQEMYRNTGRLGYQPSFWEDLPDRRDSNERLVSDVPAYIHELVQDYACHIAPQFDFTDEQAFLRSLPTTYTYHGHPMQDEQAFLRSLPTTYTYHGHPMQDDLGYLVLRCMLGDPEAIDRFVADTTVPQNMRDYLAADIAVLKGRADTIRLA